MSKLPDLVPMPERKALAFSKFADSGLLWLVNRVVFHPRGFALALDYGDGIAEPFGWSLVAAPDGEPWAFDHAIEPEKFQLVEEILALTRMLGRVPAQPYEIGISPEDDV